MNDNDELDDDQQASIEIANRVYASGFLMVPWPIIQEFELSALEAMCYATVADHYRLAQRQRRPARFPGQQALAEELGSSKSAINRAMLRLAEVGLIESRRRGQGRPNAYVLVEWPSQDRGNRAKDGLSVSQGREEPTQGRDTGGPRTGNLLIEEKETNRTNAAAAPARTRETVSSSRDNGGGGVRTERESSSETVPGIVYSPWSQIRSSLPAAVGAEADAVFALEQFGVEQLSHVQVQALVTCIEAHPLADMRAEALDYLGWAEEKGRRITLADLASSVRRHAKQGTIAEHPPAPKAREVEDPAAAAANSAYWSRRADELAAQQAQKGRAHDG